MLLAQAFCMADLKYQSSGNAPDREYGDDYCGDDDGGGGCVETIVHVPHKWETNKKWTTESQKHETEPQKYTTPPLKPYKMENEPHKYTTPPLSPHIMETEPQKYTSPPPRAKKVETEPQKYTTPLPKPRKIETKLPKHELPKKYKTEPPVYRLSTSWNSRTSKHEMQTIKHTTPHRWTTQRKKLNINVEWI